MPDQNDVRTGARLRAERKSHGFTVADLAEQIRAKAPEHLQPQLPKLRDIERTIRGHEAAEHTVGPRYRILYARAFDTTEDELFGQSEPATPRDTKKEETPPINDWDEMERRLLLRLAALGAGASALASPDRAAQWILDAALTSPPRDLDDWALTCTDHLHAMRTRPPQEVHEDLLPDLITVQHQLRGPGDAYLNELRRVFATLSSLHANVLTRLGAHGPALRWWRTARDAADASGDLRLSLLIRGTAAGAGLYGQRDPETVLSLTREAQWLAGGRPSHALAEVTSSQVKALCLLGRHDEALRALNELRDMTPKDEPSDAYPSRWTFDQLDFTESWFHASAGNEAEADAARDRVLNRTTTNYQYVANCQLHQALCSVRNGGFEHGARQATAVLGTLPSPRYRSQMITATGRIVLSAVPPSRRRLPAVRELHEVLQAG
jgi:transcriptional regulator with XRE-family HTH domain